MQQQPSHRSDIIIEEGFDPIILSRKYAIVACFPQSRAGAYLSGVSIARNASWYDEKPVEGTKIMHFCAFSATSDALLQAHALVRTMRGYNGLLLYAGGKLQDWARMIHVLDCYSDSTQCNDVRAHCIVTVFRQSITSAPLTNSFSIDITPDFMQKSRLDDGRILFPCRLLAQNYSFKFQPGHPSSESDQIQAGAVREGISWCPNFIKGQELT